MIDVWKNYTLHNLPLDTIWTDIDYMYSFYDFTIDTNRFNLNDIRMITDRSKPEGLHWVPILDPGVSVHSDAGKRG